MKCDYTQFVDRGPQWVRSSRGFEVAFVGQYALEYREGDHVLVVPVEPLFDRDRIELSRALKWQTPHDKEDFGASQQAEVRHNIECALQYLRTGYSIG